MNDTDRYSEGYVVGYLEGREHERLLCEIKKRGASPIEIMFLNAWISGYGDLELEFQHEVLSYKIDFFYAPSKVAIELDGMLGHSSPSDIEKDRRRQREIEELGYTFVRFGGKEITNNASKCVDEVVKKIISMP